MNSQYNGNGNSAPVYPNFGEAPSFVDNSHPHQQMHHQQSFPQYSYPPMDNKMGNERPLNYMDTGHSKHSEGVMPIRTNAAPFQPPKGAQDLWAAVLYAFTFVIFCGVSIYFAATLNLDNALKVANKDKAPVDFPTTVVTIASIIVSFFSSLVTLLMMRKFPKFFIRFCYWFPIVLMIISALVFVVLAMKVHLLYITFVLIFGIAAIIGVIFWFLVRKRIPFAAVLMEYVADVTKKYPASLFVGYVSVVLGIIIFGIFAVGILGAPVLYPPQTRYINGKETAVYPPMCYVIWVCYLFFLYWSIEIVENLIHCTVCGVHATYYFQNRVNPNQSMNTLEGVSKNPTLSSLKRAGTTSFGSICYGSLLVAAIRIIRDMVNSSGKEDGGAAFLRCLVNCLLSCVEDILKFVNKYAFVQVAMYGKSYCHAGKDTFNLVKDRGLELVINDALIDRTLVMGSFIGGVLSCGVATAVVYFSGVVFSLENAQAIAAILIIALGYGFVVFMITFSCISSGVATVFVCLAEDPSVLYQNNRPLWNKILETYPDAALRGVQV
ncbi:MAG: choline transporter-like family protein [Bacteroidales bacterium]